MCSLRQAALKIPALIVIFSAFSATGLAGAPAWFSPAPESAPLARLSFDPAADGGGFRLGPDLALVEDEILGRPVWEHSGGRHGWIRSREPLPESFVIVARVRLLQAGHWATLAAGARGRDNRPERDYTLALTPAGERGWRVQTRRAAREHYLDDRARLADGPARAVPPALNPIPGRIDFGERFTAAPSPLADEDYRIEIEAALAEQAKRPASTEKWHELRLAVSPGLVRMYVNGMPVGADPAAGHVTGEAHLQLDRSIRVASLQVLPPDTETTPYRPVDIGERLNARALEADGAAALAAGALPAPGRGETAGIPFLFSRDQQGNDHVDLGGSFFRQRNLFRHAGAVTRHLWPDPRSFDPGRITFRLPNRAYSRLWLLAAFDETPLATPVVTARFYKPGRGFPVDASATVPGLSARSAPGSARRLPVRRADGSGGHLWLLPIELDAGRLAAEMRDMDSLSLELTREVHPFRAYPDPHNYGWFQGGAPGGVRVFAMTLEEAPLYMVASGNRHGNVYVAPEKPLWQVDLKNQQPGPVSGRVRLAVTDPYGQPAGTHEKAFSLPADGAARLEIPLAPTLNGLHLVETAVLVEEAGRRRRPVVTRLARAGSFVQLPPDTRQATLENSPWGIFSWNGGHGTHDVVEDDLYLLRAAGAHRESRVDRETGRRWGIAPRPQHIGNDQRSARPWAFEDPYDPEKYAENRDQIGQRIAARHQQNPDTPSYSMFIETNITPHLSYGIPRRYIGEDPAWTDEESRRVRGNFIYGKAICEGIRRHAPEAKIALGWATSAFTVPLMQMGFPRDLFDYIGVDDPVFERTPEMPLREVAFNRLWLLRQARREFGYEDKPIIHVESYYPSSNPLALGWRRSADHYVRLNLLARAMIPDTTFSGVFSLQDASSYWGSQHYGEHGMISRQPEADPKPAFAAYATMTRLLDPGEFQGRLETGSLSAYCLHFTANGRHVYPLWTLRGRRRAHLRLPEGAAAVMVDESGNEFPLKTENGAATVHLTPTPLWVVSDQPVAAVTLGETDHAWVAREHPLMHALFGDGAGRRYRPENRVAPGPHAVRLDSLETPWRYVPGPWPAFAENHWGMARHDGPMVSETVRDEERGRPAWQVTLAEPEVKRELTAWYGAFEPPAPLEIPGRARALGVWARGRSNWGRIVYELEDAAGETWRSVGTKDDWNCDDIHTWSYFNYDGWRYLEFPLPGHLPYDNYRTKDTVWWGSEGGDRVVQLPLRLKRVYIEMRTHHVYVNELVAVPDRSVRLHGLTAVYDDATAASGAPVEKQRALAGRLRRETAGAPLPNPIARLRESGTGAPTAFLELAPPDDYDGLVTRLAVTLRPVAGAGEYRLYVSAYEDGRGALQVAAGPEPELDVSRLQPNFPLYLFATWVDAEGRESKPTGARRILLVDDFPFR